MAAGSVASFTRKTDAQLLIDLDRSRQHKQAVSWLVSGACAAQKDAGGKDKSRGKGKGRGRNRSQVPIEKLNARCAHGLFANISKIHLYLLASCAVSLCTALSCHKHLR